LSGKEFSEACRLGLRSFRGSNLKLEKSSPADHSAKVLGPLAPAELREAVTQAERRHSEARALYEKSSGRFQAAVDERANFLREMTGSALTALGEEKLRELTVKIVEAEKSYRSAQDVQTEARIAQLRAEQRFQQWVKEEGIRRTEAAKQTTEAKQPEARPLDRLKKKFGK
jgi:hypothetical protein